MVPHIYIAQKDFATMWCLIWVCARHKLHSCSDDYLQGILKNNDYFCKITFQIYEKMLFFSLLCNLHYKLDVICESLQIKKIPCQKTYIKLSQNNLIFVTDLSIFFYVLGYYAFV